MKYYNIIHTYPHKLKTVYVYNVMGENNERGIEEPLTVYNAVGATPPDGTPEKRQKKMRENCI